MREETEMYMSINKKGFTLFEVITVMIIISIVVGASLKLTKTKLDNIKSYTYYNAYQTLVAATREMLYNFSTHDENYMLTVNPACPEGYQVRVVDGAQTCTPTPVTLPRSGQNFCQLFSNYTNTITRDFNDGRECTGSSFGGNINNEVSFANMRPDIVLRNGMRIYNINGNPYNPLPPLSNNTSGKVYYNEADAEMDIDTTGYIAFIDIDGSSGTSTLWQDIFPFYITMSGKVIPAYRNDFGGSNKAYLSVSVYNEISNDGGTRKSWVVKSVSFKEAACRSGYISQMATYCSTAPAIGAHATCSATGSDCRIQAIPPIKWFN